jgi:hypothetical protein
MKWIKLLWSIVFLGVVALWLLYICSRPSPGKLDPLFSFGAISWVIISVITPLVLGCRLLRLIRLPSSFLYIFTGTANLAIGIAGIWYVAQSGNVHDNIGTISILALNILAACFIFVDAFITPIAGLRKDHQR